MSEEVPKEKLRPSDLYRRLRQHIGETAIGLSAGNFPHWRLANLCLGVLAAGMSVCLTWSVLAPTSPVVPNDIPGAAVRISTGDKEVEPFSTYRNLLLRRKLFVLPTPTPAGRGLMEEIEKVKQKIALRGIVTIDGRWAAYLDVDEGGESRSFKAYFEGDRALGFPVKKIDSTGVVLMIAGHEVGFSL